MAVKKSSSKSKNRRYSLGLLIMATRFSMGDSLIESRPKKTRQGKGKHSKYSATSRNGAKKRYRGQGR